MSGLLLLCSLLVTDSKVVQVGVAFLRQLPSRLARRLTKKPDECVIADLVAVRVVVRRAGEAVVERFVSEPFFGFFKESQPDPFRPRDATELGVESDRHGSCRHRADLLGWVFAHHGSDLDLRRPLTAHVLQEDLADVEGPGAAEIRGLLVQVFDDLSVEFQRDAALAFRGGPTGHGGEAMCSHIIGGEVAESEP